MSSLIDFRSCMFAWLFGVHIGKLFKDEKIDKTLAKGTGRFTFTIIGRMVVQLCKADRIVMLGPEICFQQARVTTQSLPPGKLQLLMGVEEIMKNSVRVESWLADIISQTPKRRLVARSFVGRITGLRLQTFMAWTKFLKKMGLRHEDWIPSIANSSWQVLCCE